MRVIDLKSLLEEFLRDLKNHQTVWNAGRLRPYVPTNKEKFHEVLGQIPFLSRQLGRLKPYLLQLHPKWTTVVVGIQIGILDNALPFDLDGSVKGPALKGLIDTIPVVLGHLDNFADYKEIRPESLELVRADIALAEQLCSRVGDAAKPLQKPRANKKRLELEDEYDVQDVLHALFLGYFREVINEDPISKKGSQSTRADFSIEKLGLIVEVKFVREPGDQKKIEGALKEDLMMYPRWPHLEHLFFVIYNSSRLASKDALDAYSGPFTVSERSFISKVIKV